MEFDILAYNNNNNNSGGSNSINNINRPTKIAKLENDLSSSKIAFSNVGCYNDDDHMLSFDNNSNNNGSWINGSHFKSSFYSNGYSYSGGNMSASMYAMSGSKGPFTTSQWLELEQQALIYKYIIANEPIPPNLLISITRAFESACFSSYNAGFLRPNSFGWGPFHLGFSNSTDPEPGRCRRTDGKKWRCSRDAVPDQKYCERHMNRGRHRSRKPVEGQVGHSTSKTNTTIKTNTTTNLVNMTSPSSSLVVPGGGSSNDFAFTLNHNKDLHPVTRLDFLSPSISLNSSGNTFSTDKEQNLYAESAGAGGFAGLRCDALLNSMQKNPYSSSSYDLNALESNPHNSDQSNLLWQTQSDNTTQLSISIPVPLPADFMSSTSSPTGERITPISPLRLSRALDTFEMGLNMGTMEQTDKQSNWVPISWETSMGGPLGEALKTSSNNSEDRKKNDTSSPNNVLHRTALCSLSTSSGGSSPQAEICKPLENVGCNVRLI